MRQRSRKSTSSLRLLRAPAIVLVAATLATVGCSSGNGDNAVVAEVENGPYSGAVASSVEMEGPDGIVTPFAAEVYARRFEARFTKEQAIGIAGSVSPDAEVELLLGGTPGAGTPWELSDIVEISDDDSRDADDDGGESLLDPEVAAQAIIDIAAVGDYINELVVAGDMAADSAQPLISKLRAATASLQQLRGTPASNQLEAFLHQLDALERTRRIAAEDAEVAGRNVELIVKAIDGS